MHVNDALNLCSRLVDTGVDEDLVGNVQIVRALELPPLQVDRDDVSNVGESDAYLAGSACLDQYLLRTGQPNADVAGFIRQVQLAGHPAGARQPLFGRLEV